MPSQDCNKALPGPSSDLPVLTKSDGKGELEHCKESPAASDSGEYNEKRELSAVDSLDKEWAEDQHNPRNWSFGRKWTCVAIVSLYTLIPPLASSMMAPGLPQIATLYDIKSATLTALTLSIFLLTFAFSPLLMAPLSEMYGRTWVLHISNLSSLGFSLGCAFSPNTGTLLAFRVLSGFSGSAPLAIGGGSVADLFHENERASAMAIYCLGPLLGPVLGPVAGGFIVQSIGIKYVFVVIAGICGISAVVGIPLLRETYGPVVRLRRAKLAHDPEQLAITQSILLTDGKSKWEYLWINISRPIVLLCRSFICFILSLYMAFMYGIYYLMFTTFSTFFETTYGFGPGQVGLTYIGLGVGFFSAAIVGGKTSNKIYLYLVKKNGGVSRPEMRMPALFFGSFFVPIGLLWYGWSSQAKLHWIMPIIGTSFFGFGMMTGFLPIQLYLVDAFLYAASASSAAGVFRSLFGFIFPLFGKQMFDVLGLGGGNSLLAGIAIILGIPFPILIYYKGEAIRARNDLSKR